MAMTATPSPPVEFKSLGQAIFIVRTMILFLAKSIDRIRFAFYVEYGNNKIVSYGTQDIMTCNHKTLDVRYLDIVINIKQ